MQKWLPWLALVLLGRIANGELLDGGNVTIEYERSAFVFDRDDGVSIVPISPESVSITAIEDGVDLNFENQLNLSDFSLGESDPLTGVAGNFNAGFSFLPDPGFVISGYRVTLYGTYDIERPAQAAIDVSGVGSTSFTTGSNAVFTEVYETVGPTAPPLIGAISAVALVDFLEVPVGTELVYVGSDFQPDPACVEPDPASCPLIEIPIYEEVTQYMLQADLGSVGISLQGIRVQALSVPEPSSMVGAVVACGALLLRHSRNRLKK